MSLDRLQQIAAIEETTPGTLNTGVYAAAQAKHLIRNAAMGLDFPAYSRDIKRGTLTPLPPLAGAQRAKATFSLELSGEASSGIPPWDIFLRGSGMPRKTLRKITIGSVSGGPFRHGETITQASTSATAIVFFDTHTGTTTLYVHTVTGSPNNSNIWTGGTSAAFATPSTVDTAAGYGWAPCDFPTVTVTYSGSDPAAGEVVTGATSGAIGIIDTIDTSGNVAKIRIYNARMYSDGETLTASSTGSIGTASAIAQENMPALSIAHYIDGRRVAMAGARGNVKLSGKVGEPVMMDFEFTGLYSANADASLLSGVTFPLKVPPVLLAATATLGTEGSTPSYAARFSAFGLDLGHQLAYRVDASATSGDRETLITGRAGSGTLDPELDLKASYALLDNWANNTIASLGFVVGSTLGNKFQIQVPGARFTGDTEGERAGVAVDNVQFALTGGSMSNVSSSPNERNDLLIAYLV